MLIAHMHVWAKDNYDQLITSSKHLEKTYPWLSSPSLSEVQYKARQSIMLALDLNEKEVEKITIKRIFDSEWYEASVDGSNYVIDKNAKYWMKGEAIGNIFIFNREITPVNVDNETREEFFKLLSLVNEWEDGAIIYKGKQTSSSPNRIVYAFMDLNCPFCREFHLTKREELLNLGVDIWYLPFIKDDNKKNRTILETVFCANGQKNKQEKITKVYLDSPKKMDDSEFKPCSRVNAPFIHMIMQSGGRYGLSGTPLFITDSGGFFYGSNSILQHVKQRQ